MPSSNPNSPVTRRRVIATGGAALAAASILPLRRARAQKVTRLRFAHSAPTAHGWNIWAEAFKTAVEERSGGSIQVQIFPNAQMGAERDVAQAVRLGSLDMGAIGVALMAWVPEMSITDGPFLWQSRQQCYAAIDGAFGDDLRQRCLDKGFKLVGWTDLGFRSMTNNQRPINAVQDMVGLKMRVPESKAYIAMMQATGASTVAVTLSELYLALSQGVADGQDTPPSVVKSNKYYEVQKYLSRTDHVLTTAYVVVNPASFDGLDADQQEAFIAASKAADDHLRQYTQDDEAAAFAFLAEKGMEVNLTPDVASFRAACASVLTDNPDLFLPALVEMAQSTPT